MKNSDSGSAGSIAVQRFPGKGQSAGEAYSMLCNRDESSQRGLRRVQLRLRALTHLLNSDEYQQQRSAIREDWERVWEVDYPDSLDDSERWICAIRANGRPLSSEQEKTLDGFWPALEGLLLMERVKANYAAKANAIASSKPPQKVDHHKFDSLQLTDTQGDEAYEEPTWTCKELLESGTGYPKPGKGFKMSADAFRKFRDEIAGDAQDRISKPTAGRKGSAHKFSPRELDLMINHAKSKNTPLWKHYAATWDALLKHDLNAK